MKHKILIIDDEPNICWALKEYLADEGFETLTAASAEAGLELIAAQAPALLLLDIILPGKSGLDALDDLKHDHPQLPVIIMTAHGSAKTAIEAIRKGAYDYVTKPLDMDHLLVMIRRALESRKLSEEIVRLRKQLSGTRAVEELMVGKSRAMQEVYKKIGAVSASDASVLVTGESGTGKELTARAIHLNSARAEGPFVPINSAAVPETLLESELFGHEKGAFTGAVAQHIGKFEKANRGTVFLDEIGDISPMAQAKLLRFLEDRCIERVGGRQRITVDVRIIAATHRNLEELVREGKFREDLYYRLNVVTIRLPALRERLEDLPLLIAHILRQSDYPDTEVSKTAMDILERHRWSGNVRELKNAVEHATVLCRGATILPEHLPKTITAPAPAAPNAAGATVGDHLDNAVASAPAGRAYDAVMRVWEEPLLRKVMERFHGNQVKAAEYLGIHRTTLRNKLKDYGVQ